MARVVRARNSSQGQSAEILENNKLLRNQSKGPMETTRELTKKKIQSITTEEKTTNDRDQQAGRQRKKLCSSLSMEA